MGLFGRIYQQGQARSVSAEVGANPPIEDPEYRRTVTPIRPGVGRPAEKKETSWFAWAILGIAGLFGAGYFVNSVRPAPKPQASNEEEEE